MILLKFFIFIASMSTLNILAQEGSADSVTLPTIVVEDGVKAEDANQRMSKGATSNISPYSTFKTENVSQSKIKDNRRQNLTELVRDQVGVEAQTYCANCGAKRLTINGLKGEHTSILIDGISLHSAVSSFYGVDNIPITALTDVEVMRGTGASLTNPEAIGGTLNLVTANPLQFSNRIGISYGMDDDLKEKTKNAQFLVGHTDKNKDWGFYLSGQMARADSWDENDNNVSEMPQRENTNIMAKGRWLKDKFDVSLRLGYADTEILGGYVNPTKPDTVRALSAGESDFVNGNVNEDYIGDPAKITDWISLERKEVALNALYYLNDKTTMELKFGHANQEQSAIYQHGFDYANNDNLFVVDTNVQYVTTEGSILKAGLFLKDQRLRSASLALFDKKGITKDNFDYLSTAGYLSYSLFFENFEMDFALRADHINLRWLELDNKIDKTVLAPRFLLLHNITEHLTQRFSYGLGYRAPLTFFESQHGNNEGGYEVKITDLEKSHSLVYSLSYNTPDYYFTLGTHYTHLENMAYGDEQFNQPIAYQNDNQNYDIWVNDLLLGWQVNDQWLLETSYEHFHYQDGYKGKLPTAAIEQRVQLKSTFETQKWGQNLRVTLIPSRDLSPYGSYTNHYINRDQSAEPNLSSSMIKNQQKAPTFATLDFSIFYKITPTNRFTFSIDNVFDYTQASKGDSPATWHWHFNHAHFDGLHTWGPNTGRIITLAFNSEF